MPGSNRAARFWNRQAVPGDASPDAPGNAGLGKREREALARENSRAFGKTDFAEDNVRGKAEDAHRRATNNGRRNTGSGRGSGRRGKR